jgi:outer membrane protein assembly factor BamB
LVTRIDPATNSVVDEITVPGQIEGDVWVDGSDVYVLGFTASESGSSVPLVLVKVDATDHTIEWRVPIPGQWSQTVFVASGSVWVLGTKPDARGPVEVDTLYRLDPETGTVLDQVPLPSATFGYIPAVSHETVWFLIEGGVQRFDAASASFLGEPIAPGPGCCGGLFVSDGSGGVWVIRSAEAEIDRSIWHIDASGAVVASGTVADRQDFEDMQGQSYTFDPATQTIWVQHYEDSVSRIEITVPGNAP